MFFLRYVLVIFSPLPPSIISQWECFSSQTMVFICSQEETIAEWLFGGWLGGSFFHLVTIPTSHTLLLYCYRANRPHPILSCYRADRPHPFCFYITVCYKAFHLKIYTANFFFSVCFQMHLILAGAVCHILSRPSLVSRVAHPSNATCGVITRRV